ncbi:MAG: hypothetical protein AABY32_00555 [Nanoarchaeota archaeon]
MNKIIKNKKFSIGDFFPKNQRGTDKILSMYWFVILALVAGGIFAMVYNFYGAPYDVREVESAIFAEKITDCISREGIIDSEFFVDGIFNTKISESFIDKCNFNFKVEDEYGNEDFQYFYEVEFYTPEDAANPQFSLNGGNINWKNDCFIKKEKNKEYNKLAKCTERRFYALNEGGKQYLIKILSVIGKSEKNVRQ